jgi:hypothetical protein
MTGWTVVYSDGFPPAVELRRVILEEHGIPAVVLNKRDSSYLFGFVELLVQEEDVEKAEALLKDAPQNSDS